MIKDMDAAGIIESIKELPPEEQGKVVAFARTLPNQDTLEAMREPTDELPRFDSVEELFEELEQ